MAFVAPVATRAAAGSAASAAGGSAAAARGTKAAKAAPAAKAGRASKAIAAPDRARQLLEQGTARGDAARILRDEYGSTLAEAEGLLPAPDVDAAPDVDPAAEPTPVAGSASRARSLPKVPKTVTTAANAGGGLILGTLSYVLALAYLRGGSAGVKAWLRAKFLNRTGP